MLFGDVILEMPRGSGNASCVQGRAVSAHTQEVVPLQTLQFLSQPEQHFLRCCHVLIFGRGECSSEGGSDSPSLCCWELQGQQELTPVFLK